MLLLWSFGFSSAAEVGVCAIAGYPAKYDHQILALQGAPTALKETTSQTTITRHSTSKT
jgi:hypothetical protein